MRMTQIKNKDLCHSCFICGNLAENLQAASF